MEESRVKIAAGGRIVIPASVRNALGVKEGDELILRLEQGELRLLTVYQAIERAQNIVSRYVSKDRSLADELIAERREASEYER